MKAILFAAGLISFVLYQSKRLNNNPNRNLNGTYKSIANIPVDKKTFEQKSTFRLNTDNLLTTAYSPFRYTNDTTN